MSKVAIPLTVVFLGLGLLASSFYWTSPLGPPPRWTEGQALQRAEAAANYHRLAHERAHDSHGTDPEASSRDEPVRQARENWEKEEAKLQAARLRHHRVATVLKWSGIALAAGGVAGFLLLRARSD
jgi:hypothetical protein